MTSPLVLLVQLPIPPPGPRAIAGNVPLAAAYLKMLAGRRGLADAYRIEILPAPLANRLGDAAMVDAILARRPWMVGFTCYVWNIERTLWVADRLKQAQPGLKIVVGGPEITADNAWVLQRPGIDYAAIGEGEQTFVELLAALRNGPAPARPIAGLAVLPGGPMPSFRKPLPGLDEISSPYLEGILDAAEERLLLLETVRGCRFQCKFCYYPKSYDSLYLLSPEKIEANLRHAVERDVEEVILLDPTLNQRRDFDDFLRLLARGNPGRRFVYSAELRAEGIRPQTARLLREANFREVEVGLQSVDPVAQELMGRKVNLPAFERGVRAMLDEGIVVRTDLILGLPGDTADSIRRGIDYLVGTRLFTDMQVFNLSVLPGTAFRHEAERLGLAYQNRPPYYVLRTPSLDLPQLSELMEEAQEAFGIEFDPFPPPVIEFGEPGDGLLDVIREDLDSPAPPLRTDEEAPAATRKGTVPFSLRENQDSPLPMDSPFSASRRAQALTLWFRARDLDAHAARIAARAAEVLADAPHTTLQVILEPVGQRPSLSAVTLERVLAACFRSTSYLDLYYSLHPNRLLGAKRLIVLLPARERPRLGPAWIDEAGEFATLAWYGEQLPEADLMSHEHVVEYATPARFAPRG